MFRSVVVALLFAGLYSVTLSVGWNAQGALAIDCGTNASHNAFFGRLQPYDTLLYMNPLKLDYSWLRVVEADVNYPSRSDVRGIINYIEILDQFKDGNGACAYLTNGGIGEQNVTIHVKSQRSYGIDVIVRIFGQAF